MNLKAMVLAALLLGAVTVNAKPNVIFILTDDLGFGDVGFSQVNSRKAGEARILTPTLDQLADEGVVLTDHYCAAPVCAPSRASILTGRLQGRCSVKDNQFDRAIREPDTLATVMKKAGYHTLAVGKWGIGGGGQSGEPLTAHPLDKGFDRYYGFLDHLAGHTYYHYKGTLLGAYMGITEDRADATDTAIGRYSTDLFTARAKSYLTDAVRDHAGEPFFLYLAVNTVHGSGRSDDSLKCKETLHVPGGPYPEAGVEWPLDPEPLEQRNTWIDPLYRNLKDKPARYATAVTRLDHAIADLLKHLEKLGVLDNTIIIFTSDNGPAREYGAEPEALKSAGDFRGIKRDVYEGGERVPTFVWRRGGFAAKFDTMPSVSVDWMPTLADIAGAETPEAADGVSLWPRWQPQAAVKDLRGSRIETHYKYKEQQDMMRVGRYSVVRIGGEKAPWKLFDLSRDIHQDDDLMKHPAPAPLKWEAAYSEEAKREWVKPVEVLGEGWDPCVRVMFRDIFRPLAAGATNATDAVQRINAQIWSRLGVTYSTARDAALQSPYHSISRGLASCTGMAILQINAYRAVGIPARLVSCNWTKLPGNHSWVEFMDEQGEWHFFGDGDPSPIDDSWVAPFAAEADATRPDKRVYASRATPNAERLKMWRAWAKPGGWSEIWGDDITERYRKFKRKVTRDDVPKDTNYTL